MHRKMLMRSLVMVVSLSWLPALSVAAQPQQHQMKEEMLPDRVMGMSKYGFSETVNEIQKAIETQGMMVIQRIDHQAMLSMVGVRTKGMVTLEFFHPKYGKALFENDHRAGIEIPLRIVVMEGDMGVMFTYRKPSITFGQYPKLKSLGEELDGVLAKITDAVAKR